MKILIADDEQRMRILVSDFLTIEGYEVIEATDGQEALRLFNEDPQIHLVILDVMMPYVNGWQVCETIRCKSSVPILMLTAKNTEPDELNGFSSGADDYITKPFNTSVFVARVNALMNRTYGKGQKSNQLSKGLLQVLPDEIMVKVQDEIIDLSATEYQLLLYLIENENHILTREQLLDQVWGYDYEGSDRTVDTHINRLRMKLKQCGHYIQTKRGFGYKFEVVL